MTPEQFVLLQSVFEDALQRPPSQRRGWAEAQFPDDPGLRESLLRLLEADESGSDRLERSLVESVSGAAQSLLDDGAVSGDLLGRYRLLREIGRGGMGRVFEAEFDEVGVRQRVAIKLLRRDIVSPSLKSRFLRERRILAALVHPGIARLRDIGESAAGDPFLVMELAEGFPITQWCAERKLSIRERLVLFRQVLSATSHAHRQLIVHRDLKPGNVLVNKEGHVKLLDFGIAKAMDGDEAETQAYDRMLTPAYAAPEQLVDGPTGVASDVYSLGAMLYELVTGSLPHSRSELSAAEFQRQVALVPPLPIVKMAQHRPDALRLAGFGLPERWRKECPEDLDVLIQTALRKSPGDRFQSVDHFDEDVQRLLEMRPVHARGGGAWYRARCFIRRHRAVVAAASMVGLSFLGGSGVFVYQAEQTARERDRAKVAIEVLQQAFQSADPFRLDGGAASARSVLQGAGERLLLRMIEDPDTYASVALDLVETQFSLGMIAGAETGWIRKVLDHPAMRRIDGGERAEMLRIKLALALENKADSARRIESFESRWPRNDRIRIFRAQLAMLNDRPEEALGHLAIADVASGDRFSVIVSQSPEDLWRVADALQESNRLAEALRLLEAMVSHQAESHGENHPRTLVTRLRLADARRADGEDAEALREFDALYEGVNLAFGEGSSTAALLRAGRARALLGLNHQIEAADAFLEAERMYAISLGASHRNTIKAAFNAAQILSWREDTRDRGLREYDRVIALAKRSMPENDALRQFIEVQRAAALRVAGRPNEARTALMDAWRATPSIERAAGSWRIEALALLEDGGSCQVTRTDPSTSLASRLSSAVCGSSDLP